ncbi:hypothetical protein ACFL5L_00615 [candidate division KSB1 bacterium]
MKHVILGIVAIIVGVWLIVNNWWAFLDLLWVIFPLFLIFGGTIALVAGISKNKK